MCPPSPSPERHNIESNHALYLINPALKPVSIEAWESENPRIKMDLPTIATPFLGLDWGEHELPL